MPLTAAVLLRLSSNGDAHSRLCACYQASILGCLTAHPSWPVISPPDETDATSMGKVRLAATKWSVLFLTMALLSGSSTRVRAEGRPSLLDDHKRDGRNIAIELDAGWRSYGSAWQVAAPSLNLRYTYASMLELIVDWPLAIYALGGGAGRARVLFDSGNPTVFVHHERRLESGYVRFGIGITLPVADTYLNADRSSESTLSYPGASTLNSLYDAFRYLPGGPWLHFPARIELRRGYAVFGGEAALIAGFHPFGDPFRALSIQVGGLVGVRVENITVGTRLQFVSLEVERTSTGQLAIAPFAQADFTGGAFIYARVVLGIGGPVGLLSGEESGPLTSGWALFSGGGARF